jgi:hypothetical protein
VSSSPQEFAVCRVWSMHPIQIYDPARIFKIQND